MRHRERIFGAVLTLAMPLSVIAMILHIRPSTGFLRYKPVRLPEFCNTKQNDCLAPVRHPARQDATIDIASDTGRDACAREAAVAIEAILDRRCPDMKMAFWSAVERLYRLDVQPGGQRPEHRG